MKKTHLSFFYSLNGCSTATTAMQNNLIQKQVSSTGYITKTNMTPSETNEQDSVTSKLR